MSSKTILDEHGSYAITDTPEERRDSIMRSWFTSRCTHPRSQHLIDTEPHSLLPYRLAARFTCAQCNQRLGRHSPEVQARPIPY